MLLASRQGGHPLGVGALEQFVKDSSNDTLIPPQFEGYGVVDQSRLSTALGVAGTLRTVWVTAT
ncbi:MAG: hypothetical protein QOD70_679 [Frankiales bacterium]|nr:hypothetical protein [Frankiales bacterium]